MHDSKRKESYIQSRLKKLCKNSVFTANRLSGKVVIRGMVRKEKIVNCSLFLQRSETNNNFVANFTSIVKAELTMPKWQERYCVVPVSLERWTWSRVLKNFAVAKWKTKPDEISDF